MQRSWTLSLLLTLGVVTLAGAQTNKPQNLPEGTPVILTGRVSDPPAGLIREKRKMQVAVGPQKTDYTIHFRDAVVKGYHGDKADADDLKKGMWVRVEGTVMDDPRRVMANGMRVIGLPQMKSLRGSIYFRRGFGHGYVIPNPGGKTR